VDIVFIASGGGHTGYAIAIAERLRDLCKDIELTFIVPSNDRWSINRIRKRIQKKIHIIEVEKPLKPGEPFSKIFARMPKAIYDSLTKITGRGIIICTGSNHGLAPSIIGKYLHRYQLFCLEDIFRLTNMSKANRILYRLFNAYMFLQWSEQKKFYPKRSVVVGPVYEKPIYSSWRGDYVLVITGTMGHKRLIDILLKTNLENVVVQTGPLDPSYITRIKPEWKSFRYDPDIDKWIAGAKVVISHPGVTMVNAVLAYHKPVIVVYNPDIPAANYPNIIGACRKLGVKFLDIDSLTPSLLEEIVHYSPYLEHPHKVEYVDGALNIAKIISRFVC